jgi:serine protease Do
MIAACGNDDAQPILELLRRKELVVTVDGTGAPDDVEREIRETPGPGARAVAAVVSGARGMAALCATLGALSLASPSLARGQSAVRRADTSTTAARAAGLGELSNALQVLVQKIGPAVVPIFASGYTPGESAGAALLGTQRSAGSGVVLDAAGYIVTNAHVVRGARRIQVVLPPAVEARSILKPAGRTVGAQLVGIDEETDLAVLKVDEKGLLALPLGDSDALRQGQIVLAFGSPFGFENSVTMGVVSSVARQLRPDDRMIYVQTDAPINPGNSGGPLVDVEGRVVGINTMIISQSGGSEGLGLAAPSNIVRTIFEQIRASGRVRRGEIGARAQSITPALAAGLGLTRDRGVIVSDVRPGGPAEKAGLERGDIVLALDGKPMENARQLEVNLYRRPMGGSVTLEVLRGSRPLTVVATVADRPGDPERLGDRVTPERNLVPPLGILALDLDDELLAMLPPLRARAGVVVAAAAPSGPHWADPLAPGDVIYAVNQQSVAGVEALRAALSQMKTGDAVALQIERSGQLHYLAFTLE